MGYDGAVNGVNIFHGVAVEAAVVPGLPGQPEMVSAQEHPGPRPHEQDGEVERIVQRVIRVIGDRERGMRWLGTPVRALNFATPISLLHDAAGREQVLSVLTNLEYGVL
jgi:hypothetical protein